jgi:hypothetical protein
MEKASLWNPNLLQSASKTWGNSHRWAICPHVGDHGMAHPPLQAIHPGATTHNAEGRLRWVLGADNLARHRACVNRPSPRAGHDGNCGSCNSGREEGVGWWGMVRKFGEGNFAKLIL